MDQAAHTKIVSFTWNIADDVRNVFVRGKYRDVILPMCVLRRLVGFLGQTKKAVLETKEMFERAKISGQLAALCSAAGQAYYSPSKFMLRDVKALPGQRQLRQDFEEALQRRKRANPDDSSDMTWMPFRVPTNKPAWRSFVASSTA
jgi:type I restriction enzyme M protein